MESEDDSEKVVDSFEKAQYDKFQFTSHHNNLNLRTNPNSTSNSNPNPNSKKNPNPNSRTNPNPNPNSRINPNPNPNSRINPNPNLNLKTNPNPNLRTNPNPNPWPRTTNPKPPPPQIHRGSSNHRNHPQFICNINNNEVSMNPYPHNLNHRNPKVLFYRSNELSVGPNTNSAYPHHNPNSNFTTHASLRTCPSHHPPQDIHQQPPSSLSGGNRDINHYNHPPQDLHQRPPSSLFGGNRDINHYTHAWPHATHGAPPSLIHSLHSSAAPPRFSSAQHNQQKFDGINAQASYNYVLASGHAFDYNRVHLPHSYLPPLYTQPLETSHPSFHPQFSFPPPTLGQQHSPSLFHTKTPTPFPYSWPPHPYPTHSQNPPPTLSTNSLYTPQKTSKPKNV